MKHAIAAGESVYRLDVKSVEVQDAKTALNNAVRKLGVSPGSCIICSRYFSYVVTLCVNKFFSLILNFILFVYSIYKN